MKIPSINAYRDMIYSDPVQPVGGGKDPLERITDKDIPRKENGTAKLRSDGNLITQKERDFFIKMFPENQQQLEKHVVFNSNGRLQTHTYSKGIIIDGRV
jgi:hypothetical protein